MNETKQAPSDTTTQWTAGSIVIKYGVYRVQSVTPRSVVLQPVHVSRELLNYKDDPSYPLAASRRYKRKNDIAGWSEYVSLGGYRCLLASEQRRLGDGVYSYQECLDPEMGLYAPVTIQIYETEGLWAYRYLGDGEPVLHLGGVYSYTTS